jgi:hypothetical protein
MTTKDPRDEPTFAVLARIIKENPKAGRKKWRELYEAEIMADSDLQEAVAKRVFEHMLADIKRERAN